MHSEAINKPSDDCKTQSNYRMKGTAAYGNGTEDHQRDTEACGRLTEDLGRDTEARGRLTEDLGRDTEALGRALFWLRRACFTELSAKTTLKCKKN